ncbi:MAG: DUF4126 family protein, partial [Gemmatimonadales bacterium]
MTPFTADLPLTILAAAAAIGLSPYAALAALGLLAYAGGTALPPDLVGLATPALWLTTTGLTVIDGVLSHFRLTDLVWNVLHTIARPLAAFLFAAAVLADLPTAAQWLGSLAALLVALFVHISVAAVRTAARTAGPESWRPGFTAVRLICAALIMVAAFDAPVVAVAAAAILLIAPLPWSPRLWGAASLAISAMLYILTRPDRRHAWTVGLHTLPRAIRAPAQAALGSTSGPIRQCRATLARFGARWPYWRGWIVVAAEKPALFLHRRGFRPRTITLRATSARIDDGPLIETLEVDEPVALALCLGPDAPSGPAILTVLRTGVGRAP